MCYLRRKSAEQFADFTGTESICIGDTGAFYFDNISAEDVKEKKGKKNCASRKKLLTSIKEKGPLGKKSPFTRKKRAASKDQEGCGQTSQQTSPDKFESEENAQENTWSAQAYEHSAQNKHEACKSLDSLRIKAETLLRNQCEESK